MRLGTYAEMLQVVNAELVAEEVEQSILEHASVAVAVPTSVQKPAQRKCAGKLQPQPHIAADERGNARLSR
jgi:hypothetical protein